MPEFLKNGNMTQALLVALGVVAALGVVGAALSRDIATTTQILGFCTLIAVALIGLLQGAKAAAKAEEAVVEVKKVADSAADDRAQFRKTAEADKAETAEKLDVLIKVGDATHGLVNSAMGTQKRLLAVTARALADKPGATVADKKAATEAERDSASHDEKQAAVDAKQQGGTR